MRPLGLSNSVNVKAGTFAGMAANGGAEGGLGFEVSKLQNQIKVKDRELDAARKEITVLKSTASSHERLLQQKAAEVDRLKERLLKAEGTGAAQSKELSLVKMDKRKLESAVSDVQRQNDKLKEKVAQLSNKGPAFNEQVASLQSELKLLKAANNQVTEDHKAACSLLRAKDRQLDLNSTQLKAAAALRERVHVLESDLSAAKKDLEQAAAEMRTLQQVVRVKEGDIASMNKQLAAADNNLEAAHGDLSMARAAAKVSDTRAAELSTELGVTRDELARAAAVASRAAAAEAKLVKAEGVVPVGQHFEEVKHLTGQIGRLKDKLGLAERDLAVAHAIKEKYRSALEAASINIAELDAAAANANAAAAAAGPTTAAARTAVRRSLGGSSAHRLLGLSPPASPEPVVHGGGRRLSGQVAKSPQAGRASAAGLPAAVPKPVFRPGGSASPGFGR
ncbi:hypothetical protein COO60DRAFT_21309 [Scenedesmus sp. NREL 46B-D3]|nr:hypothetical protein COO60DRAFT_21309 [Scenedesmus sp. NREL 46B-D3]